MNHICASCKRPMDQPTDPTSRDCGGDCLRCMALCFDSDCRAAMAKLEPDNPEWRDTEIGQGCAVTVVRHTFDPPITVLPGETLEFNSSTGEARVVKDDECDHDWELIDESFGVKQTFYWHCKLCDATSLWPGEFDD